MFQSGTDCCRSVKWRAEFAAVLVMFGGACARNVATRDQHPPDVTWEAFVREVECATRAGHEVPVWQKDVCLRKSFEGLVAADENAHCSRDADCGLIRDWPPLGPSCLPVRRESVESRAHRELRNQFIDLPAVSSDSFASPPGCVVACIDGRCRVPGRVTLILESPEVCSPK